MRSEKFFKQEFCEKTSQLLWLIPSKKWAFERRNNNDNDKKDTKMRKQRKLKHWKVSFNQPRFHVLEGLQMTLSRNVLHK